MREAGSERPSVIPRSSFAPSRDGAQREYLAFGLGDEQYALPLSSVREIMTVQPLTEVPRAPKEVLGIFSVRGGVTTLMDTRRCLGLAESPLTPRARVLLVDSGAELIGLLVDRVDQVYRLAADEIELASSIGGDLAEHVVGIGRPGTHTEEGEHKEGRRTNYAQTGSSEHDILILLDPVALLKE